MNSQVYKNHVVNCEVDSTRGKVSISFAIYELMHEMTFTNIILHLSRLDCHQLLKDDIAKWHLYLEYSQTGSLVRSRLGEVTIRVKTVAEFQEECRGYRRFLVDVMHLLDNRTNKVSLKEKLSIIEIKAYMKIQGCNASDFSPTQDTRDRTSIISFPVRIQGTTSSVADSSKSSTMILPEQANYAEA